MKNPAFMLYVRDWLCSKTVRQLHAKHPRGVSAYLFLLCESWLEDPPATLPNDPDELAYLARVSPAEFEQIWTIIGCQFEIDENGRLYNIRLMEEWKRLQARQKTDRERKRSKGKRTGKRPVSAPNSDGNRTGKVAFSAPHA